MIYKISVKLLAMLFVHLNINCVLFENECQVQNQYMKEMLKKAFNRKQTTQNFSSKQ